MGTHTGAIRFSGVLFLMGRVACVRACCHVLLRRHSLLFSGDSPLPGQGVRIRAFCRVSRRRCDARYSVGFLMLGDTTCGGVQAR
jgi:hypothetical protein